MATGTYNEIREIYLEAMYKIDPDGLWVFSNNKELRKMLVDASDASCQTREARIARKACKDASYVNISNGSA